MFNVITFKELDSTNKYAKENIDSLNNYDVVLALNQTKGRGREKRVWVSSSSSLTFSIVIKDDNLDKMFSSLSLLSAASVYLGLSKYLKNGLSIKWPNDIYYKDKKICGILLEGVSYSDSLKAVIIGIGINVNNNEEELTSLNATSLFLETSKKYNTDAVFNSVLVSFDMLYNELKLGKKSYYEIIKNNNYLKDKEAYAFIDKKKVKIKVLDVLDNDKLLVKNDDKLSELSTGEISFHL